MNDDIPSAIRFFNRSIFNYESVTAENCGDIPMPFLDEGLSTEMLVLNYTDRTICIADQNSRITRIAPVYKVRGDDERFMRVEFHMRTRMVNERGPRKSYNAKSTDATISRTKVVVPREKIIRNPIVVEEASCVLFYEEHADYYLNPFNYSALKRYVRMYIASEFEKSKLPFYIQFRSKIITADRLYYEIGGRIYVAENSILDLPEGKSPTHELCVMRIDTRPNGTYPVDYHANDEQLQSLADGQVVEIGGFLMSTNISLLKKMLSESEETRLKRENVRLSTDLKTLKLESDTESRRMEAEIEDLKVREKERTAEAEVELKRMKFKAEQERYESEAAINELKQEREKQNNTINTLNNVISVGKVAAGLAVAVIGLVAAYMKYKSTKSA